MNRWFVVWIGKGDDPNDHGTEKFYDEVQADDFQARMVRKGYIAYLYRGELVSARPRDNEIL